jgi:hypothetical protein
MSSSSSSSASSGSSERKPLFTPDELVAINDALSGKSPQEILTWAIDTIPQGALWQTTAFGLYALSFFPFPSFPGEPSSWFSPSFPFL